MELVKHDLARERPPRELLEKLVDGSRLADFVNTRSPSYKARGLDVETMTKKQAIDLMLEDPNLIKRPLLLSRGKAVFGWNPSGYDSLIRK